jgi:hypothetical protein
METYNFISLPANKYTTILKSNELDGNPSESAPSDVKALAFDKDLDYPGIGGSVQLSADRYYTISKKNLDYSNPGERSANSVLLSTTVFQDVEFNSNPNAFRETYSFNAYNNIPSKKQKTGEESYVKSENSEIQNIRNDISNFYPNKGQTEIVYKVFGKN